jgi:hypothetical protein
MSLLATAAEEGEWLATRAAADADAARLCHFHGRALYALARLTAVLPHVDLLTLSPLVIQLLQTDEADHCCRDDDFRRHLDEFVECVQRPRSPGGSVVLFGRDLTALTVPPGSDQLVGASAAAAGHPAGAAAAAGHLVGEAAVESVRRRRRRGPRRQLTAVEHETHLVQRRQYDRRYREQCRRRRLATTAAAPGDDRAAVPHAKC